MTTTQTRLDAAKMIVDVLADRGRSDRNLRRADDGSYYTTPDRTFLTDSGPETPPYVTIPVGDGVADDDLLDWAFGLLDELDTL